MKKHMAILMIAAVLFSLAACGAKEETTLSGIVVSVDGTVISLMEMNGNMNFGKGERPQMPEGMEGFNPEEFDGTMPNGKNFPQWGDGEMPEIPEGMTPPEGMTRPENGERPDFRDEDGSKRPGFGNIMENVETRDVDIADAHISVEIENGKEAGSLENIVPGTFVTITMNSKGKATYVLVASGFSFRSGNRSAMN